MKQYQRIDNFKKQAGNTIAGLLILVAIIGCDSTNSSSSSTSTVDVMGSSITDDAAAIKSAFDTMLANGASSTSITFIPATAGDSNILDPTTGIPMPVSNANAFLNTTFPNGAWIYQSGLKGSGVGTTAAEISILVPGVKDGVCQQINNRLYGSTTIPASGLATTAFTTGALESTPSSSNAADMSAVAAIGGWVAGCVTTTDGADRNVFFRVLKAN